MSEGSCSRVPKRYKTRRQEPRGRGEFRGKLFPIRHTQDSVHKAEPFQ